MVCFYELFQCDALLCLVDIIYPYLVNNIYIIHHTFLSLILNILSWMKLWLFLSVFFSQDASVTYHHVLIILWNVSLFSQIVPKNIMVNWVIILLASFKWIAFYVIYHFDWDIALWAYIYYFFLGNQIGWYLFIGYHPCNMFWYWTHHLYVASLLLGTNLTIWGWLSPPYPQDRPGVAQRNEYKWNIR